MEKWSEASNFTLKQELIEAEQFNMEWYCFLVNCYSLNSVGPTMENLSGPRRFLAVHFTSALSTPAVDALGAIIGLRYDQRCPRRSAAHGTSYFPKHAMWLLGGAAVSWLIGPAWKGMIRDAKEDMQHIAQVFSPITVIRLMSRGVDRRLDLRSSSYWSVGPAWKYESIASNGQRIFSD
ncbi:hypothetical protein GOBAR_AA05135 [Gossypium barbadense]|uniref:Uncharacterized protein n=1 Tax=Gossypium barbadense TaxID=3634 RepID=A0A2P5YIP7_GOSBA|nr:hypothetical protein GOBAR_AA05135 [Gossypium barbadense]